MFKQQQPSISSINAAIMSFVKFPKDPDQLRCWVCGAIVFDPADVGWTRAEEPGIIEEGRPKWKDAWEKFRKTRDPLKDCSDIRLSASEVDVTFFQSEDTWLSLCRLSRLPKPHQQYVL